MKIGNGKFSPSPGTAAVLRRVCSATIEFFCSPLELGAWDWGVGSGEWGLSLGVPT
jgi:hypothetical protein